MMWMTLQSIHNVFVDAQDRVFAVKIAALSAGSMGNLTQEVKEALDLLSSSTTQKKLHESGKIGSRNDWGFNSVSFGTTMGSGDVVSLISLYDIISTHLMTAV